MTEKKKPEREAPKAGPDQNAELTPAQLVDTYIASLTDLRTDALHSGLEPEVLVCALMSELYEIAGLQGKGNKLYTLVCAMAVRDHFEEHFRKFLRKIGFEL